MFVFVLETYMIVFYTKKCVQTYFSMLYVFAYFFHNYIKYKQKKSKSN